MVRKEAAQPLNCCSVGQTTTIECAECMLRIHLRLELLTLSAHECLGYSPVSRYSIYMYISEDMNAMGNQ